jgi:hypothetical protein
MQVVPGPRSLRRRPARRFLLLPVFVILGACGGTDEEAPTGPRVLTPPSTGPYVSVAVDDHFHDIHRDLDVRIAEDRPFVVRNEGRNLHNFKILNTDIDVDVRPGDEFRIEPLSSKLEPGRYLVTCRYHDYKGMVGGFTVTPAE